MSKDIRLLLAACLLFLWAFWLWYFPLAFGALATLDVKPLPVRPEFIIDQHNFQTDFKQALRIAWTVGGDIFLAPGTYVLNDGTWLSAPGSTRRAPTGTRLIGSGLDSTIVQVRK